MADWNDNPTFGYAVQVATELKYCEVTMRDHAFEVVHKKSVAEIQLDDQLQWRLTAGIPLPKHVIAEIGQKIESIFM
jgi:hypothetical protein